MESGVLSQILDLTLLSYVTLGYILILPYGSLLFLFFSFLKFFIVVQLQLPCIFPIALLCLVPLPHPESIPPIALAHESCIHVPWLAPSFFFPHQPFPSYPLVTVNLFYISKSLLLFCSLVCFVDQVPLIGEIIWYFSFTTWLISLRIILSSFIQAVAKVQFLMWTAQATVFVKV